jgi:hypothetical protein
VCDKNSVRPGLTKWAPDVPWAEIRALRKLLAPRPEKSKIRHEIEFFKKNEPPPDGVAMSELSNDTKKHTSKSRETVPLKGPGHEIFALKVGKIGFCSLIETAEAYLFC